MPAPVATLAPLVVTGLSVTYPDRTLSVSTFTEPGANGRVEQFLIQAGD